MTKRLTEAEKEVLKYNSRSCMSVFWVGYRAGKRAGAKTTNARTMECETLDTAGRGSTVSSLGCARSTAGDDETVIVN